MDTAPSTLELALDAPAVFHAPSCSPLRVLVACEYSGAVRDAFRALGHDAMSCDLLPTDADGPHYCGDVRDLMDYPWDLMIAHPPCTHLSVSGAKHFAEKRKDGRQQSAVSFFMMLARSPIPKIAIENPVCIMSSMWRKPDQVIQPWQFGHGETKATCLWLKGLPKLQPTNIVEGREQRIFKMPPSADRWKLRSKTYTGIAQAMAAQWSAFALSARANSPSVNAAESLGALFTWNTTQTVPASAPATLKMKGIDWSKRTESYTE